MKFQFFQKLKFDEITIFDKISILIEFPFYQKLIFVLIFDFSTFLTFQLSNFNNYYIFLTANLNTNFFNTKFVLQAILKH